MSIQSVNTPNIVHTRSLRMEEPIMAIPNCTSTFCGVKNTPTKVPKNSKDWFKKPLPVQSQKTSFSTKTLKFQEFETHNDVYPNMHLTNIPSLSIADRVKLRKTRNTVAAMSSTSEDSQKKFRSIKSEYIYPPNIVHTRISKSSKLKTRCNDPPKKRFKKIHSSPILNTATALTIEPNDSLKIPFSIKNENSSTRQVFYTKTSEQKRLYKNSPNLTNKSMTLIPKQEEICEVENSSIYVSTNICSRKKVNSTIKSGNVQHELNGN